VRREGVPAAGGNGELAGPWRRSKEWSELWEWEWEWEWEPHGWPLSKYKYTGVAWHGEPMTGADGRAMGAVDA
jgi:hypothetical protein